MQNKGLPSTVQGLKMKAESQKMKSKENVVLNQKNFHIPFKDLKKGDLVRTLLRADSKSG